jgi:hypothetical protein
MEVKHLQLYSSVGIAADYALDDPGSFPGGARLLSSPQRTDRPSSYPMGIGGEAARP